MNFNHYSEKKYHKKEWEILRGNRLRKIVFLAIIVSILTAGCSGTELNITELNFIEELTNQPVEMLDETAFEAESKKGLYTNFTNMELVNEINELGVNHTLVNIDIGDLLTNGRMEIQSEDGERYRINRYLLYMYDRAFHKFAENNIVTTVVLLASPCPYEIVEDNIESSYGNFNMHSSEGRKCLETVISFLAERYSRADAKYGQVANWIVGNEVNNPSEWNDSNLSIEDYMKNYAESIRMVSNTIRSISPYSRIYISLDHFWNSEAEGRINAKQFVNYLAQQLSDVYWNVAYHPYPYSLLDPKTWLDPVTYDENTEVISMKNISVLTEYMKQFPNPDGSQKRVILSEVGFQGTDEEIQAAAYVYSYYQAEANPDIDSLILNRHVDHSVEIAQGAYFGLWKSDPDRHGEHPTEKRKLWYVFRDIDTEKSEEVAQFALPIIGAEQWVDVINNYAVS